MRFFILDPAKIVELHEPSNLQKLAVSKESAIEVGFKSVSEPKCSLSTSETYGFLSLSLVRPSSIEAHFAQISAFNSHSHFCVFYKSSTKLNFLIQVTEKVLALMLEHALLWLCRFSLKHFWDSLCHELLLLKKPECLRQKFQCAQLWGNW